MLESGIVSTKNEVNIMMKNVVDVVLGGMTYWAFGYGISMGKSSVANPFFGFGQFFYDPDFEDPATAEEAIWFFYQVLSLAVIIYHNLSPSII